MLRQPKAQTMKHYRKYLLYYFLLVLMVPNLALDFTESMSAGAKLCNVLLPLSAYYVALTRGRNCGRTFWMLFPFVFLGAFQVVLLYLYGQSVIAVDMFLNLVTTNTDEALELLDNLLPGLFIVAAVYIPPLIMATRMLMRHERLPEDFVRRERRRSLAALGLSLVLLVVTCVSDNDYELKSELYPVNVCYNAGLAIQRTVRTDRYAQSSKGFTYHAETTHPAAQKEVYVMVVGETSRACNWSLFGYGRNTNPRLSQETGVVTFPRTLSESNTTHKSVPMLMSPVSALDYDSIYYRKGIVTAFKEAGFATAFFSNQRRNHSFIDFFGMEADVCRFIKEDSLPGDANLPDEALLGHVADILQQGARKQFILLHTYGSHFNYRERYPADKAVFRPDSPTEAEARCRNSLLNAYDNTICYTDEFLSKLIALLHRQDADAALLYTSDHGEDIFDDRRGLFLHASPVPSYYQIHVPFLAWTSDGYRSHHPSVWQSLQNNRMKNVSSSASFFPTMLELAGIRSPYRQDSLSVADSTFTERKRVYLNDHNEARPLEHVGLKPEDFALMKEKGIAF